MAPGLWNGLVLPCLLPIIISYIALSYVFAFVAVILVVPGLILRAKLYWACPFIPYVWKSNGFLRGACMRWGFESTYCMNVVRRLLTLPLRPYLPDFYIVGFPKCGTTSLANHLKLHPAIGSQAGLRWHDTLSKESHYFNGVFGPRQAAGSLLYRSFFPTILHKWWAESVLRVNKWMCFDACPMPSCLPYTAKRIAALTPNAKLIFMLRDPVNGVFSGECMFRNMGMPLEWTLSDAVTWDDDRFKETPEETEFWKKLENLQPSDPLPENLPNMFYFRLSSLLRAGTYADRIKPFLDNFPSENIMFIDFQEFVTRPEAVLQDVFKFLGVQPELFHYAPLPPAMKTDYKGRKMHPTVKTKLRQFFEPSNLKLYQLLGRDFQWAKGPC